MISDGVIYIYTVNYVQVLVSVFKSVLINHAFSIFLLSKFT